MLFTLPSGTEIELQEMTGREEAILTNKRLALTGDAFNKVMKNCTLRIGDKTEITDNDFLEMLSGDRLALLLFLRKLSYGDEVELSIPCSDSECDGVANVLVDLNDIEIEPYGSEREFTVDLPSGKKVSFVHLTGSMEKRIAALDKQDVHTSMLMRIKSIDGQAPNKDSINGMSIRDIGKLRTAMNDVDGGPDTVIETACPKCGSKIRTRLEGESNFFFPSLR